jgi:heme oxygenase
MWHSVRMITKKILIIKDDPDYGNQIMIQENLKKDTRSDHERTEETMFVGPIMSGTLSLSQYKQVLTTNYLIHEAFEDILFAALPPSLADPIQLSRRRKLPSLQKDLQEIEMPYPTGTVTGRNDFACAEVPALLGALYVLEGATLGGSVILKKLVTNPHVNYFGLGFHYYGVYGDELIINWKTFCTMLNQQPEADYPAILAGARSMFSKIGSVHSVSFAHS